MEIIQPKVVYYDIEWNKVRTIKDLKSILQILASKVVIDHNDPADQDVFDSLKDVLKESDEQDLG